MYETLEHVELALNTLCELAQHLEPFSICHNRSEISLNTISSRASDIDDSIMNDRFLIPPCAPRLSFDLAFHISS